jgi:PncC family amidohydrolase
MTRKTTLFIKRMKENGLTLALAESMTCGLAAHQLSTTKGTNDVLSGSIVCYNEDVKLGLFGVPRSTIRKHSCESMQVTEILAKKLKQLIKADVYAAITGLASAGGSETKDKPPGTVFFCIRYKGKLFKERVVFRGSPLEIRTRACMHLYEMITRRILLK